MKRLILAVCLASIFAGGAIAAPKKKATKRVAVPLFSAQSYLIADSSGVIMKEMSGDSIRPIASITKLMGALLVSEQSMDEMLEIPTTRTVQSSIPRNVRSMARKDLLTLSLVKSDNFAAQILCGNLPNCIERMNAKAVELGMKDTKYFEPTGLSADNVSTAHDLLRLVMAASENNIVTSIASQPVADIPINGKMLKIKNTNPLTNKYTILLSKTGFTNPAGGCLVMMMNSPVGQRILILLGSRNTKTRIPDMESLVKDS
jgi:D-alanyl-D-alanine endopeptidase (penicillin-binding protein 7)